MSRWKFEIENDLETFEVNPMGRNDTLKFARMDDRIYDFSHELSDLVFVGEDFKKLHNYELNYHCLEQTLRVYQMCGLVRKLRFQGTFSMSSGKWEPEKCRVTFKIEETDRYLCVNRKKEYNVFDLLQPNKYFLLGAELTFDFYWCWTDGNSNNTQVCDDGFLEDNNWGFHSEYVVSNNVMNHYLRLVLYVPIGTEIDGWTYVDSDIPNRWKYVLKYEEEKHADLFKTLNGRIDHSTSQLFFVDKLYKIDNGFQLIDVLESLLHKSCPDIKIVSDFFQWNPENVNEINYVTNQYSNVKNLKLFQKSDIKRPSASNPATKGEINFISLLENIIRIFNCGYSLTGNTLRIEHISWFEQNNNLDLVQIATDTKQTTLQGSKVYSYDKTKLPKYERFEWMDEVGEEFAGTPIWYSSGCVEDDEDLAQSKTNNVDRITTDILSCITSGEISDDGFVIVACDNANTVIWKDNILSPGKMPNNVLAWTHLHIDYWKHGRVLEFGHMNIPEDAEPEDAFEIQFSSTVSVKDQEQFGLKLNCEQIQEFNPLDFQKSTLGWGSVKTAELNLNTDMMNFELSFKQE